MTIFHNPISAFSMVIRYNTQASTPQFVLCFFVFCAMYIVLVSVPIFHNPIPATGAP